MNRKEPDRRARRTRRTIVETFDRMALQRPYDDIQVADVIRDAGVGRSTFYEHFRNKDELLRLSVTKVLTGLADAASDAGDTACIMHVLGHFWEFRQAARAMLHGESGPHVARRLAELIETRLSAAPRNGQVPAIPLRLAAAQIAGAQLALIGAWLDGVDVCSPAELATALHNTTRGLVSSIFLEHGRP